MTTCDPQALSDLRNLLIIGFAFGVLLLFLLNQPVKSDPPQ